MSNMKSLMTLNLSHNNLSGSIPSSFKDLGGLSYVDISYNHLEGPLPNISAFREAPPKRLKGNKELCGKVGALLPPCNAHGSKKDHKGGHGNVYRVNLSSRDVVPVKKLHLLWNGETEFQKAFLNGVRALSEIRHQSIHYYKKGKRRPVNNDGIPKNRRCFLKDDGNRNPS
ncbi:putative leucine-rich repeat receptor-like protein kinase [Prunus yedoensis var. nudiflora]|uniref:non-specific serine/threonine protein kinase n=1 Tax=Prunus yedoensis var. nudiflora TaxID=2094558 RepID=A0A314UIX6_PRUYE|nr:putative leucine-rich repeat receptor-like protein kinase [Prunus yedoensis var. nudiflora]